MNESEGVSGSDKQQISKNRYIVEQYFGLSHLHGRNYRASFTSIVKNRCLDDLKDRSLVEAGDETAINEVFPTKKDQNPYAGSLVGLGNYASLVHLAYVVADTRGLRPSSSS